MADSKIEGAAQCPYLRPARPYGGTGWIIGLYCRQPGGAVRVPRRDEQRAYCLSDRWPACPRSQAHASAP